MCLWPTVPLTVYTRCFHTWPRLLWSPCPGTFLLPLKSFVPSPSYPESFMLRTGSPAWAIAFSIWRHDLQRGLCTLQKQKPFLEEQCESLGVCRGTWPRAVCHCTATFPTQLEGHQGLSCLISSWQV